VVGPTACACLLAGGSCGSSILKKGLYDLHSYDCFLLSLVLSAKHRKKAFSALSCGITPSGFGPSVRFACPDVPDTKLHRPYGGIVVLQVSKMVNKKRELWGFYSQLTGVAIASNTVEEERPVL
jgi:hypothetical protein